MIQASGWKDILPACSGIRKSYATVWRVHSAPGRCIRVSVWIKNAALVYSVDKFPGFLVPPSRIAKAGTSSTGVLTL